LKTSEQKVTNVPMTRSCLGIAYILRQEAARNSGCDGSLLQAFKNQILKIDCNCPLQVFLCRCSKVHGRLANSIINGCPHVFRGFKRSTVPIFISPLPFSGILGELKQTGCWS